MPRCPDCSDASFRRDNGCDEPALDVAVFETGCPRCRGFMRDCPECEGRGEKVWRRCPAAVTSPGARKLVDSYVAWDRHGVMPAPGGWEDQSRVWTRLVRVVDAERARIEAKKPRPKTQTH